MPMFKEMKDQPAIWQEKKQMQEAIQSLLESSRLSNKFFLFTVLSAVIATLGLIMNNLTVLIGAMLISPLIIPIIGLSVGAGARSLKLILHSLKSFCAGLILSVGSAMLITWLVKPLGVNQEIYATFNNVLLYALVALCAGTIAVYSWIKPKTTHILPGAGIAVALVPPLAFLGEALMLKDERVIIDVLQLLWFNITGLFLGGFLTFIFFSLFSLRPTLKVGDDVNKEAGRNDFL